MPNTWEVLYQSVIAFFVLLILARVMGKRQLSQLTFFDYIVGITVGNVAASWSLDDVKTRHALICLFIWTGLSLIVAWLQRKSYRARIWIDGRPTVLVEHGKVLEHNLKRVNLSVEEMMALLRQKDIFKLSDVEYAILETTGKISVMKKADTLPVTPKDAGIPVAEQHEPRMLIIDGNVMEKSLKDAGYSKAWLLGEIMKHGARDFSDVFLAQVDSNGRVYVDLYEDRRHQQPIREKPLLAATLKKIQADLELFALETNNEGAKRAFADMANKLQSLLEQVGPVLRE
ncbi:MAG: DUF421 domain-containing protein [Alicyclobacillaceae bacterium]|nr:DUF421 domain-containing protein [Alicyclobacillaceae bacterium]